MEININNLTKTYLGKKKPALNNVSLSIPGGVFGLIGENGAGKTTLLKILSTVMHFDGGDVQISGLKLPLNTLQIRAMLGYLPQNFSLFQNVSVHDMLDYIASLRGDNNKNKRDGEIKKVLEMVNLEEKASDKIKNLSGGMKQRLGIAQCLIGDPSIIIMDEPTVGLDPKERLRFRNLVNRISENRIILISTHIIDDISILSDNVAIMKDGSVIYCGELKTLIHMVNGKIFTTKVATNSEISAEYSKSLITVSRHDEFMELRFFSDDPATANRSDTQAVKPNLEDAYIYQTSKWAGNSR